MGRGGANNTEPRHSEEEVLAAMRLHKGRMYAVAEVLDVCYETVRSYRKRWPSVQEAYKQAKGRSLDTAEERLDEAVDSGESWAICFKLKTQGKERGFSERQEFRHGGDKKAPPIRTEGAKPFTFANLLNQLSPEAQKEIAQALEKENEQGSTDTERGSLPTPTDSGKSQEIPN